MMALSHFITASLLLASTACSSLPNESARDQYNRERQDESTSAVLLPNEATDHSSQVESLHFSQSTHEETDNSRNAELVARDLPDQKFLSNKHFIKNLNDLKLNTDNAAVERKISKRSYTPWDSSNLIQPSYQSISIWKPPIYQLSRPYYVPIFGIDGRIPIYYPPQPLYRNPGLPQDNRQKPPYVGPTYLPPSTTEAPAENTTMTGNRFNNDDDDRPIWDSENLAPPPNAPDAKATRPPATITTQAPPLVRPTGSSQSSQPAAPLSGVQSATPPPGPSRCVWAIISCCSATSEIRYNCFEQLGCTGAFWDASPCDSAYAEAAIEAALKYYDS